MLKGEGGGHIKLWASFNTRTGAWSYGGPEVQFISPPPPKKKKLYKKVPFSNPMYVLHSPTFFSQFWGKKKKKRNIITYNVAMSLH